MKNEYSDFRADAGAFTLETGAALGTPNSATATINDNDSGTSCSGVSFAVNNALNRFKRTGNPISGSTDPMSAGNGSLMRLSPIAIRYWDDPVLRADAAARQSRTTHGAPEAVDACIAFADMLADAIAGKPVAEILGDPDGGTWTGSIKPIMRGSWRGKPRSAIQSSGYVAHTPAQSQTHEVEYRKSKSATATRRTAVV